MEKEMMNVYLMPHTHAQFLEFKDTYFDLSPQDFFEVFHKGHLLEEWADAKRRLKSDPEGVDYYYRATIVIAERFIPLSERFRYWQSCGYGEGDVCQDGVYYKLAPIGTPGGVWIDSGSIHEKFRWYCVPVTEKDFEEQHAIYNLASPT